MDILSMQLLLAFGVGSFMVTSATVAAERLGSKVGGLIGGLPVMVSVTLLFIGMVQTPRVASEAAAVVPLTMGLNGLFLVAYAVLARWGGALGLAGALVLWLALAALVVRLDAHSFAASIAVFLLLLVGSYLVLEKRMKLRSSAALTVRYSPRQLVSRAVFSGSVVTSGVYLSKIGGPTWGGLLAAFPTVFISTLVITWQSLGVEFSRRITKALLLSGMVNVVVYATAVHYLYPTFGLAAGTSLAVSAAALSAYGTFLFMREMMA